MKDGFLKEVFLAMKGYKSLNRAFVLVILRVHILININYEHTVCMFLKGKVLVLLFDL